MVRTLSEDAWDDFHADRLTDPMRRYAADERDVFMAGWRAAEKRSSAPVRQSVWITAPNAVEEDPE